MHQQKFRKLEVWKIAMDLVEDIYRTSDKFPMKEVYGLINQIRRSAVSIALNIAEGSGAGSDKEFNRFLSISLRSAYETMCALEIAHRLKYCPKLEKEKLEDKCEQISAMISGLKKKLKPIAE